MRPGRPSDQGKGLAHLLFWGILDSSRIAENRDQGKSEGKTPARAIAFSRRPRARDVQKVKRERPGGKEGGIGISRLGREQRWGIRVLRKRRPEDSRGLSPNVNPRLTRERGNTPPVPGETKCVSEAAHTGICGKKNRENFARVRGITRASYYSQEEIRAY